jgi:hypothetical protein
MFVVNIVKNHICQSEKIKITLTTRDANNAQSTGSLKLIILCDLCASFVYFVVLIFVLLQEFNFQIRI